jgi:hypothetical protein
METNTLPGADAITLPAGTYELTIPPPPGMPDLGPYHAAEGDLDIRSDLSINGAGRANTVVDGGGLDRVFFVKPSDPTLGDVKATITGLTISNGNARGNGGGGILTWGGTVTLDDVTVTGNSPSGVNGRFSSSSITLVESRIEDNAGPGVSSEGALTIARSTIAHNASGVGASGSVSIVDSLIESNGDGIQDASGISLGGANATIVNTSKWQLRGMFWQRHVNLETCYSRRVRAQPREVEQRYLVPQQGCLRWARRESFDRCSKRG